MARGNTHRRHHRSKRRRRLHFRMDPELWRAINHHHRPWITIHVGNFSTVDQDLGHQSHHDGPLPPRSERDGGEAASQTQRVAGRPGIRGTAQVVLATALCNAGDKDHRETGHRSLPSRSSVWRGVGGARRAPPERTAFRRPTPSSTSIRAGGSSTRGRTTAAYRDIGAQKTHGSSPRRSAALHTRVREKRRRAIKSRVPLRRTFPSGLERPHELQGGDPWTPKRDRGDLSSQARLCRL
mgnify:CR=1 FL=1